MKEPEKKADPTARLLAEARRAAAGEVAAQTPVIEVPDRELLRALRRASDEERRGLLKLLARVGARGKRVAELALAASGFDDGALRALLDFLAERQPDHPLVGAYASLAPALTAGDVGAALSAFERLPPPLQAAWSRAEGVALLDPLAKGLEELMLRSPDHAATVLEALGRDVTPAVIEELRQLFARCGSKPVQKAIRSAFFRLEQRGVTVPTLGTGEALTGLTERTLRSLAFLTPPDSSGDQGVTILEELPEGGASLLQAVVDGEGAIGFARSGVTLRRGLERIAADLRQDRASQAVEIEVPLAIGILEEAYARNPAVASDQYVSWREAQAAARRARRPELTLPAAPADEADQRHLVDRSADLFEAPATSGWHLTRDEAEAAEKLLAGDDTPLIILPPGPEAARRSAATTQAAVDAVFPRPARIRMARRLEGAAIYWQASGEERLAQIAVLTAAAVSTGASPPFLAAVIERSVALLKKLREKEKDAKPIVAP